MAGCGYVLSLFTWFMSSVYSNPTSFGEHIENLCRQNPTLVLPHPHECQLYYDCSTRYNTIPPYFEQHLRECPYPDQFSTQTKTCEDYRHVTCNSRTEHKNACNYRSNMINDYHLMCTVQAAEGRQMKGLHSKNGYGRDIPKRKTKVNSQQLNALKNQLCKN